MHNMYKLIIVCIAGMIIDKHTIKLDRRVFDSRLFQHCNPHLDPHLLLGRHHPHLMPRVDKKRGE